jgi:hypothetical protein
MTTLALHLYGDETTTAAGGLFLRPQLFAVRIKLLNNCGH